MSCNLLLIPRKEIPLQKIRSIIDDHKLFIEEIFSGYFNKIAYNFLNDGSVLIEFINKTSNFYHDVKGNWICYEGIVFSLKETKKLNSSEILTYYLKYQDNFSNYLDGHFVIKIYDMNRNKYIIANDIIKNKTNYISYNDEFIMITPFSILSSIINTTQVDLLALNELFWRYYILSNKSLIKNVTKIEPATIISVSNGELTKKKYWNWPKNYTTMTFNDCVSLMINSIKETANLIHNSYQNPCIDFTMGQDSRMIVAGFASQNLSFTTTTFGSKDFKEVINVSRMSKKHGISNHNIILEDDFIHNPYKYFNKAIDLSSGEEPGYLLGRIMYMREKQLNYGDVVLNGMDGHFYKNGLWDEMYTFNFYFEPAKFDIKNFLSLRLLSNKYDNVFFNEEFKNIIYNSKNYFTNLIEKSIKNYKLSPVSIQVDKFDLENWLNFGITTNSTLNNILPSLSPLLLRRNLELALTIPVKWKFNLSKFQRAVVYGISPDLAKEKTDFGGLTMKPLNFLSSISFLIKYYLFQNKRLINKLKTKVGMNVKTHIQEAWDYRPIYQNLYKQIEIKELLKYEKMVLSDIIDKQEWEKFRHNFKNKDNITIKNYELIFKIASVEKLLRKNQKYKD